MSAIKHPMQRIVNQLLDHIRLKSTCTDAVVILIDQHTGEFKVASLRGEINHMTDMVKMTLASLEKQRRPNSLILPN